MAKHFAPLSRYWQKWEPKLEQIVKSQGGGARLHFPSSLKETTLENGLIKIEPVSPVCFFDAPQKASSTKHGASHRYVIFVNGCFELDIASAHPNLTRSTCSVTFLDKVQDDRTALTLQLVDAIHFDVETVSTPTPFHPAFHVQRGIGITEQQCRDTLASVTHHPIAAISVDLANNNRALSNPAFRIPTPQLDIFSVLTMLTADYFCNAGLAAPNHGVTARFKAVLQLLTDPQNFVKQGLSAQRLHSRIDAAKNMSAAHWYPEC